MIKITPIKRPTKSPPSVGKVPAEAGTIFLPVYATESGGNPAFAELPIDAASSALQPGGNMEGKEVRPQEASVVTVVKRDELAMPNTTAFCRSAAWCRWST